MLMGYGGILVTDIYEDFYNYATDRTDIYTILRTQKRAVDIEIEVSDMAVLSDVGVISYDVQVVEDTYKASLVEEKVDYIEEKVSNADIVYEEIVYEYKDN